MSCRGLIEGIRVVVDNRIHDLLVRHLLSHGRVHSAVDWGSLGCFGNAHSLERVGDVADGRLQWGLPNPITAWGGSIIVLGQCQPELETLSISQNCKLRTQARWRGGRGVKER